MFRPLALFNRDRRAPAATGRTSHDPFFQLQDEMNRLFYDAFASFGAPVSWRSNAERGEIAPSLDLRETDAAFEVEAELPGVDENDIDVEVVDNVLTIRGEKRFEKRDEDKKGGYHYVERAYGSFARSVPLPAEIDPERVEAVFKNGVLKLTLPKPPEAQRRAHKVAIAKG